MEKRGQTNKLVLLVVFSIIFLGIVSAGIVYNGIELVDSTVHYANNTASADKLNMHIEISPDNAGTINGKNITQFVDFKWKGLSSQKTSWVFVYDSPLEKAQMFLPYNTTQIFNESYYKNTWITNYSVDNVNSYVNLGTPDSRCQMGNTNNTMMFEINQSFINPSNLSNVTTQIITYCFTSVTTINSSSYLVSGNYDGLNYQIVNKTVELWNDISPSISFMGCGLLNDSRCYYQVQNVTFNTNQEIRTKWVYTPFNATISGKWHIFGYDANLNISDAVNQNKYIYIDPSWNSSFSDSLQYYWGLNEGSGATSVENISGKNFTVEDIKFWNSTLPINGAYSWSNGSATTKCLNTTTGLSTQGIELTISFWFQTSGFSGIGQVLSNAIPSADNPPFLNGTFKFRQYNNKGLFGFGNVDSNDIVVYLTNMSWNNIVLVVKNDTPVKVYVNGAFLTDTSSTMANFSGLRSDYPFKIWGTLVSNTGKAGVDEIAIWNRTLTANEITGLWNGGTGIFYSLPASTAGLPINVTTTLVSPPNNTVTTNLTLNFSASAQINNSNITNMTLFIWNSTGLFNISSQNVGETNTTTWLIPKFKIGNYTWNVQTCSANSTASSCNNQSTNFSLEIRNPVNVTFNIQNPADISSLNLFGVELNISYNISNSNASLITFFYKTNRTSTERVFFLNGTAYNIGYHSYPVTISNQTNTWYFTLKDDDIYPAKYNFNETEMQRTTHIQGAVNGGGQAIAIEFLNVNDSRQYNQLEIMMNASAPAVASAQVWFCNSSGVNRYTTSNNCTQTNTVLSTVTYNETENNSRYVILPIAINTTTGFISTVRVTERSYFVLRGAGGGSWFFYNVSNISRAGASRFTSNTGATFTNQTYTVDAHFHQYDGTSTFFYYVCANSTIDPTISNCSVVRNDLIDLGGLPPTSPQVYSPVSGYYNISQLTINWTASVSPNAFKIDYYNISLLNADESFNKTILANVSNFNNLNLSYVWDITSEANANYIIKVTAYDNNSLSSFGLSNNFTIDTIKPMINFTTLTPSSSNLSQNSIFANVTSSDVNFANITINLYNSAGIVNSQTGLTSNFSYNFTSLADDIYYLNATALDLAGNSNSTETRTILADANLPIINFTMLTPSNQSNLSQNSLFINVTAYDKFIRNLTIYLYNSTGLFDVVNTSYMATSSGCTSKGGCWYALGSNNNITFAVNFTNLNNETYWFNASSTDTTGNINWTETRTVILDYIYPIINFSTFTPSNQSNLSQNSLFINVTSDDNLLRNITIFLYNSSGLINSSFGVASSFSINFTNLRVNSYWFNASSTDTTGNINWTETRTVLLDFEYPQINFSTFTPSNQSNLSQNSLFINVTSIDANLRNITVFLYDSSGLINSAFGVASSFSINFTSLHNNTYWFNASSTDTTGNINWTETRTVLLDYEFPQINFTTLTQSNQSNLSQNTLFINVSSSDENIRNITIFLYNTTDLVNSSFGVTSAFAINFTNLPSNMTYWFNSSSTDTTGNINWTETREVLLDYVSPYINFTTGTTSEGAWSQTWIFVNVTANDTYLRNITLFLYNASGIINSTFGLTSTVAINFTNLRNDTYSINASATDTTGNIAWTETRSYIFLDAVYPKVGFGLLTPINNSNVSRRTIFVNMTAFDNNMKNITIRLYNSTGLINSTNVSGLWQNLTLNFTLDRDEHYWFNGTGCDLVGNCNDTETRTILLDTIKPIMNVVSPISSDFNNLVTSILIPVNFTIIENHLSTCWYYVNGSQIITNTTFSCTNVSTNFSFVLTNSGQFYITIFANDTAGNTNLTNSTFTVTHSTSPHTSGGGGAVGSESNTVRYNNSIICPIVKDFLIKYSNYTQLQLDNLTNLINVHHTPDLQSNEIQTYLDNYTIKCGSLPKVKPVINKTENFTFFELETPNSECSPNLNTTFTVLNAKFNMDSSIPFFHIDIGEKSCTSVSYLRWIFEIVPSGSYTITGIKLWWVLLLALTGVSILLIRSLKEKKSLNT